MIPQAGSAYAYSYATLGELVAWIIGWDLILEYAVGNVAVAISWGDYFNTLLRGFGVSPAGVADDRLPHGAAQRRPGGARAAADRAAHRRHSDPGQRAGVRHRDADHRGCCCSGAQARASRANNIMVVIKLLALGLFIAVGATHLHPANYIRSRRTASPASTRARRSCSSPTSASTRSRRRRRRRRTRSATCRSASSAAWRSARSSTSSSASCSPGWCPYKELAVADPLARALQLAGFNARRLDRRARRGGVDVGGAAGLPVRPAAHLLRDGARRPAAAVGREDPPADADPVRRRRCSPASSSRCGR